MSATGPQVLRREDATLLRGQGTFIDGLRTPELEGALFAAFGRQGLGKPVAETARGLGHGVVDLEDDALGAVLAVDSYVILADDGEGAENVVDVVVREAVEVKEGSVEFRPKEKTADGIPAERRAFVTDVLGEWFEVPGGVGKFEDAGEDKVC